MRILIAEDDPTFREMLARMLGKIGYDPVVAADGNEAWGVLTSEGAPQLAVLDWLMPGIDGVELCRKIRQEKPEPYTYLILLTGKDQADDLVTGMEAGADDYLVKPLNPDTLRVRLNAGRRILELQDQLIAACNREKWRAAELEAMNTGLERFSHAASNKILQSLQTIASAGRMIQELVCTRYDERCRTSTQLIYSKTRELAETIRTIQDFLKPTRVPIRPEQLDLSRIAREIADGLRRQEPGRRAELIIPEGIEATGDRELLKAVLVKLIGNAWRHSAGRELVYIEFGITHTEKGSAYFVRDKGMGFDPGYGEKVFMPFFRVPGTDSLGGHGIGLATAERIVRRHGGLMWAEGEAGKGATFFFTLPFTSAGSQFCWFREDK